ncbi:MAG TPA: bifunctional serine/threonine-protein kinase/formylglycine-generating enzyme family protein [Pyrinomonadaceae bacterium]|nr:bifunctional serine/threonine-protein kinase/formylglycine-generating enzyme family protein [Pyrinomonadaceae bacterium]
MRECPHCFSCFDDAVSRCPTDGRATFQSLPGNVALEGKYVLDCRLGEGGMGVVYKAHHKFLKTTRAIKTIKPELIGNDTSFVKRFHQEAMAAAAIGHPNIISVLDYGLLEEKIPYIVMEFVEGVSLESLILNKGRFTPAEALEYMQVITSALSAAHKHGIVHRDLKPLNIMIESGGSVREQIRILDFGLAKIKSSDLFGSFVAAKTVGIVGSPAYMAPEQWSGEETDRRCDVYSLGIILYEMLMGDVPFKGPSIPAIMKKHLMAPPPPMATAESGISPDVEKVVHRALEKQPELRTASVEEFIAEFEQAVLHPAPVKVKAKRRTSDKATATTRRRKTNQITPDETSGSGARVNAKDEPVTPVFAQDVNTVPSPVARVESENDTARLPRTLNLPAKSQPELKASGPEPPKVKETAPAEDKEVEVPELTSRPPVHPIPEPSPGRVLVSQQSFVGTIGTFFKKRFVVPAVAGVAVLGLIVLSAFVFSRKDAEPPSLQAQAAAANLKREMVLIEGGTFTMGSNNYGEEQRGEHPVTVPSFYLDKYEVTNGEYAEFLKATGRPAPENDPAITESYWEPWKGTDPPPGREDWPVANVSPKDVEAFAAWLSKRDGVVYRLPTEEEWEFAARNGSKDSLFPWGNSWERGRANINGKKSPADVGSFPQGATQSGVQDMVGNVWEFTSSKPRFYDDRRVLSSVKDARVQRGGSFFERINSGFDNATDRSWFGDENFKFPTVGFRLARDRE